MSKVIRALGALVLVTMFGATRAEAAPPTEGASASNFVVDVVVVGTPPPGAEIVISSPNSQEDEHTFPLADAAGTGDLTIVSGTIFRQIFIDAADDAGASRVQYACMMQGGPVEEPFSTCTGHTGVHKAAVGGHIDASFNGNAPANAMSTITLTFGTCDGRPITGTTGTAGNDVLVGTTGVDTINGFGGHDRICGGGGNDILRGGTGNDRIVGGNGADRVEGGPNNDALFGSAGNDLLLGQAGVDGHDGGANRDNCNGGLDRDTAVRCEVKAAIP
jgi:Ca2+-binding RTX toxin-like protein